MRRNWIAVVLVCLAWPALAQLSGSWETSLRISPPPVELERSVLTLNYGVAPGWTLTSISTFTSAGLAEQGFGIRGQFGPLLITGGLQFNPQQTDSVVVTYPTECGSPQTEAVTLTAPAYKSAWFRSEILFSGLGAALELRHWAFPYTEDYFKPKYFWPCCPPQTQTYTLFSFTVWAAPVTLTARFSDCCLGISFESVTFTLKDASMCCGITHSAELFFTKLGFRYLTFSTEIPLCCGISLEASVTFTVDAKSLQLRPRWRGLGQVCYEVYGDVLWDPQDFTLQGLVVYGYKLRCQFSDCTYIEFLTALNVSEMEKIFEDEDLFQGNEFEYIKLGFCGPGCCGGMYTLAISVYFQPSGTLFGLSRILVDMGIPVLANFTFTGSLGLWVGGSTTLSVGWIFTF